MRAQLPIDENTKVTVVNGEDWTGIYLNGKLAAQNHSVSARDLLMELGLEIEYADMPQSYSDLGNPLPDDLAAL